MINYRWKKTDLKKIKKHNKKVFTCFSCVGGSAFGYELAGYDVVGNLEISKFHNDVYNTNHSPKYSYTMDIRDFNKLHDLPAELYNLDVLDGSPPFTPNPPSSKHIANPWNIQPQNDLYFEVVKLAERLQPKIIVTGTAIRLLHRKSKHYAVRMIEELQNIGYKVQLFRLNAATMGVPQHMQRLFFISSRTDLHLPDLELSFNEKPILFSRIKCRDTPANLKPRNQILWENKQYGDTTVQQIKMRLGQKVVYCDNHIIYDHKPLPCFTNRCLDHLLFSEPRSLTYKEIKLGSSFPLDFECSNAKLRILCGMPPIMLHRISEQIYRQWLE